MSKWVPGPNEWHRLLAPLPEFAVVLRKPVAPPELQHEPDMQAIAGWTSLTVELSAGEAGLRHVLVTLDGSGTPLSAGDTVLYVVAPKSESETVHYITESIGGRLEGDDGFHGTRWRTRAGPDADENPDAIEAMSFTPTREEIAGMLALVAEVLRRAAWGTSSDRNIADGAE